jgi:hypothetical protein
MISHAPASAARNEPDNPGLPCTQPCLFRSCGRERRPDTPMLLLVVSVVLPILITVGVGFVWTRLGHRLDSRDLTALIADVATPCLVISTFQTSRLSFEAFTAVAAAAGTAIALFAGAGALLLWATGLRIRTFLPSIAFPNAGNLGLPLSLYAFGSEGLGYAIAFFSISSVANYTLGQAIAAGKANWRGLLRLPLLYAVALGIALSFWEIELPEGGLVRPRCCGFGIPNRRGCTGRNPGRHAVRSGREHEGRSDPAIGEPRCGLQLPVRTALEQRARGGGRRGRAVDHGLHRDDPAPAGLAEHLTIVRRPDHKSQPVVFGSSALLFHRV